MRIIEIAKRKFTLASRMARTVALFIDGALLFVVQMMLVVLAALLHHEMSEAASVVLFGVSFVLWTFGMFFMDGLRDGQGFGKRLLSLRVVRLKDGKPCTFKDAFVRRFTGLVLQPFDLVWAFGKNRQRIGDKLADTVVVEAEPEPENVDIDNVDFGLRRETSSSQNPFTERLANDKKLNDALLEMTNQLTEARQKVDASISIEKQLRDAYEGALAQAERCEERAVIAIQAGRDDLAREDLTRRNEYRQLATRYKTQWEEQQQSVAQLTALLETLEQKTAVTRQKRDVVIAQHRNVDAHQHLRQMLEELQGGQAAEILDKMESDASEASTLADAAAAAELDFDDARREQEFAGYAEDAAIEKELAALKAKCLSVNRSSVNRIANE